MCYTHNDFVPAGFSLSFYRLSELETPLGLNWPRWCPKCRSLGKPAILFFQEPPINMHEPWAEVWGGSLAGKRWGHRLSRRPSWLFRRQWPQDPFGIAWKIANLFPKSLGEAWDAILPSISGHQFLICVTGKQDDMRHCPSSVIL